MTVQDVDPETFYGVGNRLFELAGDVYKSFQSVVDRLGDTGAMAGSDDDGMAWAKSYDARAGEVLGAANDLIAALENYGGVLIQAGYNHAVKEHNSTPGAGPAPQRPPEPTSEAAELTAPPAAGGPGTGLIEMLGLVEQIGVPVPDGNTEKIDKAAGAWGRLATARLTATIVESLELSAGRFSETVTPEMDYIAKDLRELRDAAEAVLDGCEELSQSCKEYRAALDELRGNLKGILEQLAVEIALTALIGIAASFVSVGAGAVAAAAKSAEAVKRYAGIIRTALSTWKISKNISAGVKKAHDVAAVRQRLQRIKDLGRKGKPEEQNPGPKPPPRRGTIDESAKPFSPEERKVADLLADEGKEVRSVKEAETPGQRTPDAIVDGKPTEFKTLGEDASNSTVKNALNSAKGQADNAIIDGRGSGISQEEARRGLDRFLGVNPERMTSIRIVGDGWEIVWP
ncbi:hypothetical protein ACRCUN_13500 [Mycobacterium sp. LTG2003]